MEYLELMLFPETPLYTLLSLRPMSMRWIEEYGFNPYAVPAPRVEDLCKAANLDWNGFLAAFRQLEIPGRASDWEKRPCYHLLDFLTREHRLFIHDFIPAIRNAFAAGEGRQDYLGALHPLIVAWPAFATSLSEHITEEEAFLFPRIMQYDFCLRHGGDAPDFSEGSVRVFAAVHLMREEQKQVKAIHEFLDAAHFSPPSETMEDSAAAVFSLLQDFHHKLSEHSRMERKILFPIAGSLERQVYDRSIGGRAAKHPVSHLSAS
jgi:iron-sulfur cluster repair protein YtfE (RIC family)